MIRSVSLRALAVAALTCSLVGCGSRAPAVDLTCDDCSIVLISVDTLRADHLHSYGYERETSPHIDQLASQGVRFERAYGASYHTADSHMSMFTSLYPSVHGVRNADDASAALPLSPAVETLPERLAKSGFLTVGFHGGGNVSPAYGFGRGFELYQATFSDPEPAIRWLHELPATEPRRFFLFFHTYRPHDPYLPDPPYDSLWDAGYRGPVFSNAAEFANLVPENDFAAKRRLFWSRVDANRSEDLAKVQALYDGEIRQTDEEIGRVLEAVDATRRRVLVVLVSDHGEEFHEHGGFLHDQVYEECLHVPFIIRHPDRVGKGVVIPDRVSLVDLAPTILSLAGVPPLAQSQGSTLSTALRRPAQRKSLPPVLAEKVVGTDSSGSIARVLKQAYIVGSAKLIRMPDGRQMLFDLLEDPRESRPTSDRGEQAFQRLVGALDLRNQHDLGMRLEVLKHGSSEATPLDQETIESLRALGYIN